MSKVRVRHGADEIEIEGADEFIEAHLNSFYTRLRAVPKSSPSIDDARLAPSKHSHSSQKALSPAEYYRAAGSKRDGVSKVLVFGKYMEEVEGTPEFSPADINRVAKAAKLAKGIHPQYFANAVKQGLLRQEGKNKYSLTLTAEEILALSLEDPKAEGANKKEKVRHSPRVKDSSQIGAGAPKRATRSSSKPGGKAMLAKLYEQRFFKTPKTIADIIKHADQNLALKYDSPAFSSALARYTREGKLTRNKNSNNQYEYTQQ